MFNVNDCLVNNKATSVGLDSSKCLPKNGEYVLIE